MSLISLGRQAMHKKTRSAMPIVPTGAWGVHSQRGSLCNLKVPTGRFTAGTGPPPLPELGSLVPATGYRANSFHTNGAYPTFLPSQHYVLLGEHLSSFVKYFCLCLFNNCLSPQTVSSSKAGCLFAISLLYAQHPDQCLVYNRLWILCWINEWASL